MPNIRRNAYTLPRSSRLIISEAAAAFVLRWSFWMSAVLAGEEPSGVFAAGGV